MDQALAAISGGLSPAAFWGAVAVTLFASFVKGAIGFAMPLIMISAFAAFMPPPLALAALVLPVVVTNSQQAFRQGAGAAWADIVKYRRMIVMIMVFIVVSAQFVLVIPAWLMLGLLGVPVTAFALIQLSGREMRLQLKHRKGAEYALGTVGGLYGGISGVWGPPVIVYLVSTGAGKQEMVRVQGVVFLIGGVVLLGAHLQSGVLDAVTLPLSAALVVPSVLGMWLGFQLQDRLDPLRFRRWTLILLAITGLNLLREAAMG
ncbi:MAG: sulfite exporter TauE/SafE family protein [Alkalilacustris sp.]